MGAILESESESFESIKSGKKRPIQKNTCGKKSIRFALDLFIFFLINKRINFTLFADLPVV
jgi:hypothetical protein